MSDRFTITHEVRVETPPDTTLYPSVYACLAAQLDRAGFTLIGGTEAPLVIPAPESIAAHAYRRTR